MTPAQNPTPSNSVDDRYFNVQFKISIKALRRYMDSSEDTIENIQFSAKVDVATKSITGIQIADDQQSIIEMTEEEHLN